MLSETCVREARRNGRGNGAEDDGLPEKEKAEDAPVGSRVQGFEEVVVWATFERHGGTWLGPYHASEERKGIPRIQPRMA